MYYDNQNRKGGIFIERTVVVTHRGTLKSIKSKWISRSLQANYPIPNNKMTRFIDHSRMAVWVSLGRPTWINAIFSGMVFERNEACIIFKIPRSKIRRPNGLKGWMFWWTGAQRVVEEDITIPEDAELWIKGRRVDSEVGHFKSVLEKRAS